MTHRLSQTEIIHHAQYLLRQLRDCPQWRSHDVTQGEKFQSVFNQFFKHQSAHRGVLVHEVLNSHQEICAWSDQEEKTEKISENLNTLLTLSQLDSFDVKDLENYKIRYQVADSCYTGYQRVSQLITSNLGVNLFKTHHVKHLIECVVAAFNGNTASEKTQFLMSFIPPYLHSKLMSESLGDFLMDEQHKSYIRENFEFEANLEKKLCEHLFEHTLLHCHDKKTIEKCANVVLLGRNKKEEMIKHNVIFAAIAQRNAFYSRGDFLKAISNKVLRVESDALDYLVDYLTNLNASEPDLLKHRVVALNIERIIHCHLQSHALSLEDWTRCNNVTAFEAMVQKIKEDELKINQIIARLELGDLEAHKKTALDYVFMSSISQGDEQEIENNDMSLEKATPQGHNEFEMNSSDPVNHLIALHLDSKRFQNMLARYRITRYCDLNPESAQRYLLEVFLSYQKEMLSGIGDHESLEKPKQSFKI